MPTKRLTPVQLRDVCEGLHQKYSQRTIGSKLSLSTGVVSKIAIKVYPHYKDALGNGEWIPDSQLMEWMYPVPASIDDTFRVVNYYKQAGLPLSFIHEHRDWLRIPITTGYSQLCDGYKKWREGAPKDSAVHGVPGELCIIRNCGFSLQLLSERKGSKSAKYDLVIALLPVSGFCAFGLFDKSSQYDFVGVVQKLFGTFGAVPRRLDVTVQGVAKPDLTKFDRHYGTQSVVRRGSLKRARVGESRLFIASDWLAGQLKERQLSTVEQAEKFAYRLTDIWNQQRMEGEYEYACNALLELDRQHMLELPSSGFIYTVEKTLRVSFDNHVKYGGVYYSVPYRLIEKTVMLVASCQCVKLYDGGELVAEHSPNSVFTYSTHREHMYSGPEFSDKRNFTPQRFRRWGRKFGHSVRRWVQLRLAERPFPEQSFRLIMRVLNEGDSSRAASLNERCRRANNKGNRYPD